MSPATPSQAHIAVVGATGVVGREVLAGLQERGHPASKLTALASERSEGEELGYADESLEVERASAESFRGIALALFAVPAEVARSLAPAAQAAGAWVVDCSSAFRGQVPLVLPGVNDAALERSFPGRIVSVPSATSAALFLALEPLRRAFGLDRAELVALVPASNLGVRGVEELQRQTAALLSGREEEPEVFPHRIAFNVLPQVGVMSAGWAEEEAHWREDAELLWAGEAPGPTVFGTAFQVPVFHGLSMAVTAKLKRPASAEEVRAAFRSSGLVKLLDSPQERIYPMPMLVTADLSLHVGRVRMLPGAPEWTTFVAAADNAGFCAARNLVEVGLKLLGRH
ncbi:MAG: aspartate-semialdehyde dehydrogenase [Myxococcales bacterium]|nr:aspartate-semialdehyde dehydrogenase [Myxococcales bacterium]